MFFRLVVYLRVAQIADPAKKVAMRPNTIFRMSLVATSKRKISKCCLWHEELMIMM
jgi:hypothetical protein